jgi:GNAT superfamily N-acetyltransferase
MLKTDLETGGLRGACTSCPFNDGLTEEAAQAQNFGCLPTAHDIVVMKRQTGQNWACHDDESKACAGLCHGAKDAGVDLSEGGLIRYSSWYHHGQDAAIEEARTGYLLQALTGEAFDRALQGHRFPSGAFDAPTHARPTLRYRFPDSPLAYLQGQKDTRLYFTASTAPQKDEDTGYNLRTFVAMLAVETSPYDAKELWVKFVLVDPAHQRKGLAAKLLAMVIAHAKSTGQWLSFSYATDEGKEKFQAHLERELNASGVVWKQSRG